MQFQSHRIELVPLKENVTQKFSNEKYFIYQEMYFHWYIHHWNQYGLMCHNYNPQLIREILHKMFSKATSKKISLESIKFLQFTAFPSFDLI